MAGWVPRCCSWLSVPALSSTACVLNFSIAKDTGHRALAPGLLLSLGRYHAQPGGLSGMQSTIQHKIPQQCATYPQEVSSLGFRDIWITEVSLNGVGKFIAFFPDSFAGDAAGRNLGLLYSQRGKPKSYICHILIEQLKWSQRIRSSGCPGNRPHELQFTNPAVYMNHAFYDRLHILSSQEHK